MFSEVNLLTLDENCSNKHDLNLYRVYTCFKYSDEILFFIYEIAISRQMQVNSY